MTIIFDFAANHLAKQKPVLESQICQDGGSRKKAMFVKHVFTKIAQTS